MSRRKRQWQLLAACLLLLAALLGLDAHLERRDAEASERDRLSHLARVTEAHLSLALQSTAHALASLRAELPAMQRHGDLALHLEAAASRPGLLGIWLLDAQARPLAGSSSGSVPHCAPRCGELLPPAGSAALHLSAPFALPAGGYAIGVAQRVADARPSGYLFAILGPEFFDALLAPANYSPDVNVMLVHAGGRVVRRVPDVERLTGVDLGQISQSLFSLFRSTGQTSGVIDGVAASGASRIAAIQALRPIAAGAEPPLWIVVSRTRQGIAAHWQHELLMKSLLFAVIALTAGVGLYAYQRRHHELQASEAERGLALSLLSDSEQRVRGLFEHLPIAYQSLDIEGRWLDANPQLTRLLGFDEPAQLIGQDFCEFWDADFRSRFDSAFDEFKSRSELNGEIVLRRRDGHPVSVMLSGCIERDAQRNFLRTHCVIIDISERRAMEKHVIALNAELESRVEQRTAELARANRELRHLAHHDALTGLANRRAAADRLRREFAALQRHGGGYALLLLDIDHFKQINDRLGHDAGDRVISRVASVLREQLRECDLVARFGGEEFLALLPATGLEGALSAAEKVRRTVAADVAGVSVSVGVALAEASDADEGQAISRADLCLYQAKRAGRNRVAGPLEDSPALA